MKFYFSNWVDPSSSGSGSSLVSEVSIDQHRRSHDGPEVEGPAEPGGHDLDPDGRRVGGERADVRVGTEIKNNVT